MNRNENRKIFCRRDLILIAVIILAAGVLGLVLSGRAAGGSVIVEQGGEVIFHSSLAGAAEGKTVEISGEYPLTVKVDRNGAFIEHAACKDQVCVRAGRISQAGQAIVCLPARVVVRIEGENRSALDGMTG